jgi:hypothetical protein
MTSLKDSSVPHAVAAAAAHPYGAEPPPPPYLAHGAHNLLIRFEADEAAMSSLLPPGLQPASNIVTLNMYCVPRDYAFRPIRGPISGPT